MSATLATAPNPEAPTRRYVPTQVACYVLACSAATLHALVKRGLLSPPARLSSRALRWDLHDIEAAMERLRAAEAS